MGADIHIYLETRRKGEERPWWRSQGSRINPGRNYDMFGVMAGVRGYGPAMIEPRGLPTDVGWQAEADNRLWISDTKTDEERPQTPDHSEFKPASDLCEEHGFYNAAKLLRRHCTSGEVDAETAANLVKSNSCKYIKGSDNRNAWVTHPDWHSHSWMTTKEFAAAIKKGKGDIGWQSLLTTMQFWEQHEWEARIVFWFDN